MVRLKPTLRKSLLLYILAFALLALLLSFLTTAICDWTAESIRAAYPADGEKYYLTNEQGKRLAANFAEMWRLAEERRQLNAAFAHDLRTPLTVLKGYNEMLQLSADAETGRTAAIMSRHIARLENYTAGMSHLQRLEELPPQRRPVSLAALHELLAESAQMICARQGRELRWQCAAAEVCVDAEFVSRVTDNLLENAARYARRQVDLDLQAQGGGLLLAVRDDGPGFAPESLSRVLEPYFSGENNRAEHFGLGLYICRLLCRQHGGYLQVRNREGGGAEVVAYFAGQ